MQPPNPPARIVVGISSEPGHGDKGLLPWVAAQVRAQPIDVIAFHAWLEYQAGFSEDTWTDNHLMVRASRRPGLAAQAILDDLGVTSTLVTRCANATHGLLEFLRPSDLLVLGSRSGNNLQHLLSHNVVARVLRQSPCPVAVVPQNWEPLASTQVAVGYNGLPASEAALGWAVRHAALISGSLLVVRAVLDGPMTDTDNSAHAALAARLGGLADASGVGSLSLVDVSTNQGITHALLRAAQNSAILVVGNSHAGVLTEMTAAGVCGSVTQKATLPVIAVPESTGARAAEVDLGNEWVQARA